MRLLKQKTVPTFAGAQPPIRTEQTRAAVPLFRQEVIAFQQLSRDWGRVVPLQTLGTRLAVWLVVLSIAACVGLSFVVHYARKTVAPGYLRPATGSARIYVPQTGIIDSVYVSEHQQVEAGQPLFAVATGQFTPSGQDINATILATLRQQAQSLKGQITIEQQRAESERSRLASRMQTAQAEVNSLASQVSTQSMRIRLYEEMVATGSILAAKGLVSQLDQKRREDSLLDQRRTLSALSEQLLSRQGELNEARFQLNQVPFVQEEKLRGLRSELAAAEQRIAEVTGRSAYVVRAPIAGEVALLEASVGQNADPKRLQAEIVPKDSRLIAELLVPPQSIGLVQQGQNVRIRYDTFPYLKFGTFDGTVLRVSHTALTTADNLLMPIALKEAAYRVTVALDRDEVMADGKPVKLQPDMLLRADIILEKRTLAEWAYDAVRVPG